MINKLLFTIFLTPITFLYVNAQNLSAADLISKSICTSFECIDPFLRDKGFLLKKTVTNNYYDGYRYEGNKKSEESGEKSEVVFLKSLLEDWENSLQYNIESALIFEELKKSFISDHHFVVTGNPSTRKGNNKITLENEYKSVDYPDVRLEIDIVSKENNGVQKTYYEFTVLRKL